MNLHITPHYQVRRDEGSEWIVVDADNTPASGTLHPRLPDAVAEAEELEAVRA